MVENKFFAQRDRTYRNFRARTISNVPKLFWIRGFTREIHCLMHAAVRYLAVSAALG